MKKTKLKQLIFEAVQEVMHEQAQPAGISPSAIMSLDQFLQSRQVDEREQSEPFLGAQTSTLSPEEMQAYMSRIKTGEKSKLDKYKMPYLHGGNIEIKNGADQTYDQEKLKSAIKARPEKILKQNKKMEKSAGENTIFFDIGLPALVGLAVNEQTNQFIVVNTCPGAGACKVYCYAKKGGYVQWKDASMSQTRLLNYLVNDPQGFKTQFENELRS